jgi:hypothetical protein
MSKIKLVIIFCFDSILKRSIEFYSGLGERKRTFSNVSGKHVTKTNIRAVMIPSKKPIVFDKKSKRLHAYQ